MGTRLKPLEDTVQKSAVPRGTGTGFAVAYPAEDG
jgi:hypothetical protein